MKMDSGWQIWDWVHSPSFGSLCPPKPWKPKGQCLSERAMKLDITRCQPSVYTKKSWAAFHLGLWGPGKQGDLPFQDPKVMFSRVLPSPVLADPGGKHLPPVGLGPATVTLGFGISPVNSMSWTPITLVLIYLPSLFVVRIQVCLGLCWISPIEVSIFNSIWLIPYQCIRHLC